MKSKGYAVLEAKADLVPFEFERRAVGRNDVGFEILYAGICHSDIHQAREEWGAALFPMVPGHEIVGVVTRIGEDVSKFSVGDRIGVGVFIDSCRNCENCVRGLQQYCLEGMTGTYNGYERNSSQIAFGGYSNYFVIDQNFAVKVPNSLELSAVAPLLCAGITLYSGRATQGQVFQFSSTESVNLRIGNAGAVKLTVNGKEVPPLGGNGEVVNVSYGVNS